jgi:hypothetical protein
VKAEVQKLVSSLILMPGVGGASARAGAQFTNAATPAIAVKARRTPTLWEPSGRLHVSRGAGNERRNVSIAGPNGTPLKAKTTAYRRLNLLD